MAASYWTSSHGNRWLFNRQHLAKARSEDAKYASKEELGWLNIWSANAIHKLAKRLSLRQQVTATAIVYFRRFYVKNSFCETEPCIVAATCVYIAAKAEELPVHIKSVVNEARLVFQEMTYNGLPSDNSKLAEMEFYLLEDLEFHLIIHHPYKSLIQMTGRDGARRDNMMDLNDSALQMAWFVINDTYRTDLCLLYPPHIIAIASLYIALALNPSASIGTGITRTANANPTLSQTQPVLNVVSANSLNKTVAAPAPVLHVRPAAPRLLHPSLPPKPDFASPAGPRASPQTNAHPTPSTSAVSLGTSTTSSSAASPPVNPPPSPNTSAPAATQMVKHLDPVTFLSRLNVSLPMVLEVMQEITASYSLWKLYETSFPSSAQNNGQSPATTSADERIVRLLARMRDARTVDMSHPASAKPQSLASTAQTIAQIKQM